jgi:alpha-beta hydrolase superfamily lysophospholipase
MASAVAPGDICTNIFRGDVRLAAHLMLPAIARSAAVIFVHGLGSGKDSPRNVVIAERLRDAGIAALLFDLSGHGESSSDLRGEDLTAYCEDVAAAFRWLQSRDEVDGARIGIAGSSLGGVVALDAVRQGKVFPVSMVLRAPPLSPNDLEDVPVPTLVLAGTLDPLSVSLEAAPRSPHVRVTKIAGASHLFEEPGTLERALNETAKWFANTLKVPGGSR